MDRLISGSSVIASETKPTPLPEGWISNWMTRLYRSEGGSPLLPAEFAAGQGSNVRLIDIRDPQDFVGPLGYIPGVDWIPSERLDSLPERLGTEAPLIIISRTGERASEAARMLEGRGMRFVAALAGGMSQWLSLGFSTIREPAILDRCDFLRPVNMPAAMAKKSEGLSIEQVEQHLGDPSAVRWIKLAALVLHAPLSCIDGRDDRAVVGTPGGDAGQFLLALAAIESVLGRQLDSETISTLLERRIDAFGSFYMHTDIAALSTAANSMREDPRLSRALEQYCSDPIEWRQFLRRPPLLLRDEVLEHLCTSGSIGCGHIRLMYQRGDEYRLRPSLVLDYLRAFFHARWDGAFRAEFESLHGHHDERAVLITRVEGEILPFTPIPLVSPSYFDSQMFVYHPQVSDYLLNLLVDLLLLQTDVIPEFTQDLRPQLLAEVQALAVIHRQNSLTHLARGLPIYDVIFAPGGEVRVEYSGVVA